MRSPVRRTVCRALAVAWLGVITLGSPALADGAGSAPHGHAGPCTDDLGVTVVVDFQGLGSFGGHGGTTIVRCAPGVGGQPFQGSGLAALQAAGVTVAGTSQHGASVVCRVEGRPMPDEPLSIPGNDSYTEQCLQMPPASAFWSYWQADNGGDWTFSQLGVTASTARAGGFEALSFSLNSTSSPPRTAPDRPQPDPPPTEEPEPSPAPSPSPPPSPDPAPAPAPTPTPTPSPTPAPSPTPTPSPTPAPTPAPPPPTTPAPSPPSADRSAPGDTTAAPDGLTTSSPDSPTQSDSAAPGASPVRTPTASPSEANRTTGPDPEASADQSGPSDDAGATTATASGPAQDTLAGPDPEEAAVLPQAPDDPPVGLWATGAALVLLGLLAFLAARRRSSP